MCFTRVTPGLLLLTLGLCGCSHTGALRATVPDEVKTTASIGDRALPVVAGEPGASLRVDTDNLDLPRTARSRISGRVYDEEGRPVPNARVRLAMGAVPAGKAVFANTDRSGAFTLGGLRPGSAYTVIAEYQGEQGMMSGRADADAPETDVRIGLHLRDIGIGEGEGVQTASRPRRSKVKPISEIGPIDEEVVDLPAETAAVNREDLDPPASDDAVELSRSERPDSRAPRTAAVEPPDADLGREEPRPTWSAGSRRSKPAPTETEHPAAPAFEDEASYSEEENPLPPAIKLDAARDRSARPPGRKAAPARRRAQRIAVDPPPAEEADAFADPDADPGAPDPAASLDAPRPLPDGLVDEGRSGRPQAFAPPAFEGVDAAPARAPSSASRSSRRPRVQELPRVPDADDQVFQTPSPVRPDRPTWSELAQEAGSIPLDEALEKTAARSTSIGVGMASAPKVQAIETSASGPETSKKPPRSLAPSLLPGPRTEPFCDFDSSEPRLLDLGLADASGRIVSFRDLDADLVLLDFWGTWCDKCITSIPHLRELQAKLGGKRLQVVGIACEQTSGAARTAKVEAVVKKLDINYTVLITSMDGTCPVQTAFQIRYYPTMILLDRNGRILCRAEGATPETLARIDRYIAKNLDREPSTRAVAVSDRTAGRR